MSIFAFLICRMIILFFFFFQAEDGIRDATVTGVQTCALPIYFIKWVAAVCNAQTQAGPRQMAAAAPQTSVPQIKWKTPEGWTEMPSTSMRYASFSTPTDDGGKIDISVVTFLGDGGSDAANINRWRGQIGLAPINASAVTSQVAPLKTDDTTFSTTDIAGDKKRTIAAWTRRDGRVWFFKATGPNAAVEKEKPNFVKFIESVQF